MFALLSVHKHATGILRQIATQAALDTHLLTIHDLGVEAKEGALPFAAHGWLAVAGFVRIVGIYY